MERTSVESSNMDSVGYDAASLTLEIAFQGKTPGDAVSVYQFVGVNPPVHAALMASDSKGKFFAAQIRGRYQTTKVSEK